MEFAGSSYSSGCAAEPDRTNFNCLEEQMKNWLINSTAENNNLKKLFLAIK